MKLQAQYNRISVVSSIIVLLIAAIGYYFLLHYVLTEQLDETLRVEQVEIQDYIQVKHSLPPATTYKDQKIQFEKAEKDFPQRFSTLKLYDTADKENELSRQLIFPVEVNGQYYAASVTKIPGSHRRDERPHTVDYPWSDHFIKRSAVFCK